MLLVTEKPCVLINLATKREHRHAPLATRLSHQACPVRVKKDVGQGVSERVRIARIGDETGLSVDDKFWRGPVAGPDNRSAVQHRPQRHQVEWVWIHRRNRTDGRRAMRFTQTILIKPPAVMQRVGWQASIIGDCPQGDEVLRPITEDNELAWHSLDGTNHRTCELIPALGARRPATKEHDRPTVQAKSQPESLSVTCP